MNELWSYSTTVREADRIVDFLKVASLLDGDDWNEETQAKYQILLIQYRYYLNDEGTQSYQKLNDHQINILKDKTHQMTFEEAKDIADTKNYVGGLDMRGRQSMSPLRKLGLVSYLGDKITISKIGKMVLSNELPLEDFFLDGLLKFQYPNPDFKSNKTFNVKPFICAMALTREVNRLCNQKGIKAKGLQRIEFGIFALSIKDYKDVPNIAKKVLEFREHYSNLDTKVQKNSYVDSYIKSYLSDFKNPEENCKEYSDNLIRYLRMTKYFIIRGKYENTCYDLEPSRAIEIDSILENDNGQALNFTEEEWNDYIGTYGSYPIPFETKEKLHEIYNFLSQDNKKLASKANINIPTYEFKDTKYENKKIISDLREQRRYLQNLIIKQEYKDDSEKISEAIRMLENIRTKKVNELTYAPSLELEKWANVALNIFNDSVEIKPNTKVGDDNEPTNTAPAGVADIECYYSDFNSTCEVTMLTSRDQWYNEGQPVMRHLRDFENSTDKKCYCLFIAPSLHDDTLNTFYMADVYGYDAIKQRIIPITIKQLEKMLDAVKHVKESGKNFTHNELSNLYDECCNHTKFQGFSDWKIYLEATIDNWVYNLKN